MLHGNPLLVEKLHHILMSVMIHVFALKWQPYWIFTCRVKTNVRLIIPLCFLYFKTWVCTPKCLLWQILKKKNIILGWNNRESVAMAAILNKKISSAGIFGDFSPGCLVGIQVTFLKISAFYLFFQVEPWCSWTNFWRANSRAPFTTMD